MDEETKNAVNSEIRYITLELMKLAYKTGKSFEQIAKEYIDNTCLLQELIAQDEPLIENLKKDSVSKKR
jgi:hypothetical protein